MNSSPTAVLRHLRDLMPDRTLEVHEAKSIAERQALRLLQILGQTTPAVDVAAVAELPRIEVRVEPRLPISGFSQWNKGRWLSASTRTMLRLVGALPWRTSSSTYSTIRSLTGRMPTARVRPIRPTSNWSATTSLPAC